MTLHQFCTQLAACHTQFTWAVAPADQTLRATLQGCTAPWVFCPLTAVHCAQGGGVHTLDDAYALAATLGLSAQDATALVAAADEARCPEPDCTECALRAQLLAAVGLPAEGTP